MHDVACEFARAAVRSKDAQKQLAQMSLRLPIQLRFSFTTQTMITTTCNSIASENPALSTLNSYKSHPFIHIDEQLVRDYYNQE